jgi:hypothetical protein
MDVLPGRAFSAPLSVKVDGWVLRQQAEYWRETLADVPEPLELPAEVTGGFRVLEMRFKMHISRIAVGLGRSAVRLSHRIRAFAAAPLRRHRRDVERVWGPA